MFWKLLPWILRGLALAIVAAALHYHLPQGDVVRINGTEVKRMDVDSGELRTEGQPGATRDVRFINAVTAEGRTRVYRNEDTRWGFPPYLKFDSADITAQAQDLARRDSWALVQHYGWRIQMLSMFPNVVELTEVEEGYEYFPWAAIITLTIILGLLVAYCDADGPEGREHFMTDVEIAPVNGDRNRGYIDAGVFGRITLAGPAQATSRGREQ